MTLYVLDHEAGSYEDREHYIRGIYSTRAFAERMLPAEYGTPTWRQKHEAEWCCSVVEWELDAPPVSGFNDQLDDVIPVTIEGAARPSLPGLTA